MKSPTIPVPGKLAFLLALLACVMTSVLADNEVSTHAEAEVPDWAIDSAMQLSLSTKEGLQFTVLPLTENLGLNDSGRVQDVCYSS